MKKKHKRTEKKEQKTKHSGTKQKKNIRQNFDETKKGRKKI